MERDRTKRFVICCKNMKTTNMMGKLGKKETLLHSGQDKSKARSIFSRCCDAGTRGCSQLERSVADIPDVLDLLSKAVRITKANQMLITAGT